MGKTTRLTAQKADLSFFLTFCFKIFWRGLGIAYGVENKLKRERGKDASFGAIGGKIINLLI